MKMYPKSYGDWMCLVSYNIQMQFSQLVSWNRMSDQGLLEDTKRLMLEGGNHDLIYIRHMTPAEVAARQLPA